MKNRCGVTLLLLALLVPALFSSGCGSSNTSGSGSNTGGGSSSGSGGTSESNPVPTLTSIDPTSAKAGSSAITINATGTNFLSTTVLKWNDTVLPTTYSSSTYISATVAADFLTAAGTANITAVNPAPGGGSSSQLPFTIQASGSTATVTTLNVLANDLVWDSVHQQIYLSLPSANGSSGNSIQAYSTSTGTLGTPVFVGSEPNLLSLSASSTYLYVSLNGASSVARVSLPGLASDITIPLGSDSFYGPFYAMDVQASPVSANTVAVVRASPGVSPAEEGGVLIYDDATSRPSVLCGWIESGCYGGANLYNSIQWNTDGTTMFAANNEDTAFDFYTIPVTASGFGTPTDYSGVLNEFGAAIHFDATTGYVYDDDGQVIDPATGSVLGTFDASGIMVPDGKNGFVYFIGQTSAQAGSTNYTVEAFDIQHFTPVASVQIANVVGIPRHIRLWGTGNVAFNTYAGSGTGTQQGAVYLVDSSFVQSAAKAVTNPDEARVHLTWKRMHAEAASTGN